MFGVDQADPDASNFQSNYDDFDYAENRLVTDQKLQEHHLRLDDLPLAVDLDDDRQARKDKLSAIGTLLEKAVIKDPFRPLNAEQALPVIFVNQKLYGKATEDDPANRQTEIGATSLPKRAAARLKSAAAALAQASDRREETDRSLLRANNLMEADVSRDTINGLAFKTAFRTDNKMNPHEVKVDSFLSNWIGTTKGLAPNWVAETTHRPEKLARPTCARCGKYRCSHQMYRGKALGFCGTQVEVKDPVKMSMKSEFQDHELHNVSPVTDHLRALKKVDNVARARIGENIASFQDLIPEYSNANNTNIMPAPFQPTRSYSKSLLENRMPQQMLQAARQKYKVDDGFALDPNPARRPGTAKSNITTFDRKAVSKQFAKPTASFLQKYEYRPGTKLTQKAGRFKQQVTTKAGEKYITQHASLAGTLAVQGTQASWTSPFHRLKSAQANKRVKLQVNVMNQQKDRRKDPGLEKYANLPGMQTNFAQGSNNDSFIPVAEALHLLNQEHLKA